MDNALEFTQHEVSDFCKTTSTIYQTLCFYSPQQNGVAEHKNQHLWEVARTLLFTLSCLKILATGLVDCCFMIHRMPSSMLKNKIPCNILYLATLLFLSLGFFGVPV